MKTAAIAAAIIATTLVAPAEAGRDRPFKLKVVQCMEPYQGHTVEPQPPAYALTLETSDGKLVEYVIDNQFALHTGVPNISRFYGTQMDSFVRQQVRNRCARDNEVDSCVILNVDEMDPGERIDGVNARPDGVKYQ